jgi:hypothetical protein
MHGHGLLERSAPRISSNLPTAFGPTWALDGTDAHRRPGGGPGAAGGPGPGPGRRRAAARSQESLNRDGPPGRRQRQL